MKTILVAEDNPLNRELIGEILSTRGYKVLEACSGKEAVELVVAGSPDLVLMDIQMPDGDGYWALRQVRALPRLEYLPIVAVTALAMAGDRERILSAGFNGYIAKPISSEALLLILNKLLPQHETNRVLSTGATHGKQS